MVVRFLLLLLVVLTNTGNTQIYLFYPEVKINPLDGSLVSQSYTVATAPEGLSIPQHNGISSLKILSGQYAQFLIAIPHEHLPQLTLKVQNTPLQIFALGLVKVTEPRETLLPDILIPCPLLPSGKVSIPPTPFLPERRLWDVFFVEIPPIDRQVTLTIQLGTTQRQIQIQNAPVKAPSLAFLFNFNEYGDKYLRPFRKAGFTQRELHRIEQQIFTRFSHHYGFLNPLPYKSQAGHLRAGMGPKVLNEDLLSPQLDWQEFDQRFGPLFDGTMLANQKPIPYFYLPFNPNWPAPFALFTKDRKTYEAIWETFARAYVEHFKAKGWTQTEFQVYMNQKPSPKNHIPWNLDEPKGVKDYKALQYFGNLTHRVFANASSVSIAFRMDISHFYCQKHRGNPQKDFRVNGGWDILAPVVDSWYISIHSLQAITAQVKAKELLEMGKSVWVYGNTPTIAEAGFKTMYDLLYTFHQGWTGMLIWKTFNFTGTVKNGKDCVAYILPIAHTPQFLPSLRLKLLREAYHLYQQIEFLRTSSQTPVNIHNQLLSLLKTPTPNHWAKVRNSLRRLLP